MHRRRFLALGPAALAGSVLLRPRAAVAQEGGPIRLRDLYNKDMSFSDLALSRDGQRVEVDGFMAPPLRAESRFFVLTKMPMAVCPFCEPGQTWPDDILAVYARRTVEVIPFNVPLRASGRLELGDHTDPELGFFSRVRLVEASYARA
jgi:hypothetical protein